VSETEEFLASVLPRLTEADTALHSGDVRARKALWATADPVTLFGAALTSTGWPEIEASFDWLSTRFSDCSSFAIEVVAAGASSDLAYLVAVEHTTAAIGGAPPAPYSLRVTTIFRREAGEWKVVHRHADPSPDSASTRDQMVALRGGGVGESRGPS
jgi:ketosteroid isomerase-like protein